MLGAAFISPALFYGGAAAVAAPILIHLLARRRFRRIRWAAMDFLLDAQRRNRRRLRMEEWLLMALRCLVILLIAAMISRPFLQPSSSSAWWGGAPRTERVFLLDDSLSMSYVGPTGSVFDRAKQAVHRVIESVRRENPHDTVTLLRMTDPATPVESGTYLSATQADALFARLDALSPSQGTIDLPLVFENLAELLERNPGITHAVVYVVSDFQRQDWAQRLPDTSKGRRFNVNSPDSWTDPRPSTSFVAPLNAWAEKDRGLHLVLVNVGDDQAVNRAITKLELASGRLVSGAAGTVRVQVGNFAPAQTAAGTDVEVGMAVGPSPQRPVRFGDSKTLRGLTSRQAASVDLDAEFPRAGFTSIQAWVRGGSAAGGDGLPVDDVRYLTAEVAASLRVLIVNGEPSTDAFDDEVTFLATALRPEGEVFSGNDVVIVDETRLDEANLVTFHVVVLANVYRLSDPAVERLERYVRRGGGLMIFLGDQVDPDLYNTALYRGGDGLLPVELREVVRPADVARLIVTDRLHSAVRPLGADGDPLGLANVPFLRYFATSRPPPPKEIEHPGPDANLQPAASSPSPREESSAPPPPLPSSGPDPDGDRDAAPTRILARFTAGTDAGDGGAAPSPGGDAAIIERRFGKGRVILFTSTADKEWHLWPNHPTFLPMMMELVQYVARRSDSGGDFHVGQPIELPLDPAVYEPDAIVRTPAYPDAREVGVTAVPAPNAERRNQPENRSPGADDPGAPLRRFEDDSEVTSGAGGEGLVLRWEHTDTAGIYQFILQRRDASAAPSQVGTAGEVIQLAAVNVDPRESDLLMAHEDDLRRRLEGVSYDYVRGVDELAVGLGEARVELWRPLLVAIVVVLMLEQGLAWRWGRKR